MVSGRLDVSGRIPESCTVESYGKNSSLHLIMNLLIMIRDKGIWQDLVVDIDQPDLQIPPRLRSMVSLLSSARWVRMNVTQLSMFRSIPANSILNRTLDGAPHAAQQSFMIFGCQSKQLMGVAEFNIVLPRGSDKTYYWR